MFKTSMMQTFFLQNSVFINMQKLWAESAIFRRFVSKKKKIFTKKDDRIVFGKESYSKKKEANIKGKMAAH